MTATLHPNLDPDLNEAAEQMLALIGAESVTLEGIGEFRAKLDAVMDQARAEIPPNENVRVEDHQFPGLDGDATLRIRIHRPADQTVPLPCFYHIHGGGMIIGSVEGEEPQMAVFVENVNCVVASVDYRLAPEHPHPTPVEDCYAGLRWVVDNADSLNIDPTRIAVGGESAGGGLAAGTALMARDEGGPANGFQYLVYPMLDDRNQTPSSMEFAGRWPGWPREMNLLGWQALLGDRAGGEDVSPYAAPARASDLSGLPPAYIDVGNLEVFRDEDIEYANRLMQAGVPTEMHVYPGVFHGWELFSPEAPVARRAMELRLGAMRRALWPDS